MAVVGFFRELAGTLPPAESAAYELAPEPRHERARHGGHGVPAAARVLLRVRRPHRRRGDLQRGAGVPAAQEPQRRDDPGPHGRRGHRDAALDDRPGPVDRRQDRRGPGHPAAPGRSPARRGPRPGHRHGPGRQVGLRRLPPRCRPRLHRHRAHPHPRRQHRVQRLPGPRLDPRPGRLPAAPAAHPRRPARLLQRHPPARRCGRGPHRGLRRPGHQAHPALHRRRLRLVHPQPDRHGAALEPPPRARAGPPGPRADAAQPDHQRRRRRDVRRRPRSSCWRRSSSTARATRSRRWRCSSPS